MNGLTTVDCLKDKNIVSVEGWDKEDKCLGGECLFEFVRVSDNKFLLRWSIYAGQTCK